MYRDKLPSSSPWGMLHAQNVVRCTLSQTARAIDTRREKEGGRQGAREVKKEFEHVTEQF